MEDISNIQADLKREEYKRKYQENSVQEKIQAKKSIMKLHVQFCSKKERVIHRN